MAQPKAKPSLEPCPKGPVEPGEPLLGKRPARSARRDRRPPVKVARPDRRVRYYLMAHDEKTFEVHQRVSLPLLKRYEGGELATADSRRFRPGALGARWKRPTDLAFETSAASSARRWNAGGTVARKILNH